VPPKRHSNALPSITGFPCVTQQLFPCGNPPALPRRALEDERPFRVPRDVSQRGADRREGRHVRKPTAAGGHDLQIRALLLKAVPQQNQAALEVVFHGRESQAGVEPHLAVRKLRASGTLRFAQDLPEDPGWNVSDEVLIVDEDRIVAAGVSRCQ